MNSSYSAIRGGVLVFVLLACACSSSSSDEPEAAPVNLTTAALSTCGAPGQDPVGFVSSCNDGTAIATIAEESSKDFCVDKRFGTLFHVDADGRRSLYFCKSTREASRVAFGEQYPSAVVVHTDADVAIFAYRGGHDFLCSSNADYKQEYDTTPLPRKVDLCAGFSVEDRAGGGLAIMHSGKELQLVRL